LTDSPQAPQIPPVPPHDKKAVASLILGVISFLCVGLITGPIAVVLGLQSIRRIERQPAQYRGQGMAIAGTVCGGIAFFFYLLVAIGGITEDLIPYLQKQWGDTPDQSALNAGELAQDAQELHRMENGAFSDKLSELIPKVQGIVEDPNVTFTFGECNAAGYTYSTRHAEGRELHLFRSDWPGQ